jgi:predicted secreted protein
MQLKKAYICTYMYVGMTRYPRTTDVLESAMIARVSKQQAEHLKGVLKRYVER